MVELLRRTRYIKKMLGRRLAGRSAASGVGLYTMVAIVLIVSWYFPLFAVFGVPFAIMLVFMAILCIATLVLFPLVYGLF